MLSEGDSLRIFVTHIEKSCCLGQCLLWAQTDMSAYDRLESLVSARGVGKPGASFTDAKLIRQDDILLAQYDGDSCLYRAQVAVAISFQYQHFDSVTQNSSSELFIPLSATFI